MRFLALFSLLLILASHAPAVQTATNLVNSSCTTTVGTAAELVSCVETALTSAGWSVISGTGTDDIVMKTATTAAGHAARWRFYSNATADFRVEPQNADGSWTATNQHYVTTSAGEVFRIIADDYQIFIASETNVGAVRKDFAGGVPYVPSWMTTLTEAAWSMSNGSTSSTSYVGCTFRLGLETSACTNGGNYVAWQHMALNGVRYGPNYWSNTHGPGWLQIIAQAGAGFDEILGSRSRWFDGSYFIYEPLLAFRADFQTTQAPFVVGNLWDAMIAAKGDLVAGSTLTFDGQQYYVWTTTNEGREGVTAAGQLLLRIPTT